MSKLKKLEEMLVQKKITRRQFITQASALGLTATLGPALLTTKAQASMPKRGGRFRIGTQGGNTADSLDPGKMTAMMQWNIGWQCRNCLVEVDYNMQPIPELAEKWESSSDATKWVFKLRKGVEFHSGKTMDSADVIFSINHHRKEDSKSAAKALLAGIQEIKADGKYTVAFTLKEGSADFPFLMSDYHLQIVPDGSTDFEDCMGTGGYILQRFEPGVRALAKRNPNYWKQGRAHFDEVETVHIADVNARTNALKTGQIDLMNRCERKTYHMLKRMKGIQGIESTGMQHYTFAMLCDVPPFDNNDVRLALKYAIDREHVLKQILRGYGVVGNDHPIAPIQRYRNKDLPQRAYDPDKVKYHLKKAGLSNPTFNIHVSDEGFPGAVDTAIMYKEHAAKAGIKLNVVREPADGYWSDVWMKKPWSAVYWGGRPTADWMFSTSYAADAPWNDSHWKHQRFNKLLKAARAELDESKRRAMYYEMQQIVSDEGGVMVLAFVNDLAAASKKVRFGKLAANWEMDGMKCAERWWFA